MCDYFVGAQSAASLPSTSATSLPSSTAAAAADQVVRDLATSPANAATSGSNYSLDGSRTPLWPLIPSAIPRLEQILAGVVANASAKSSNRSFGQDADKAAAAGFVVRRGTQFFKDGKPYYFVGGNVRCMTTWQSVRKRSATSSAQRMHLGIILVTTIAPSVAND